MKRPFKAGDRVAVYGLTPRTEWDFQLYEDDAKTIPMPAYRYGARGTISSGDLSPSDDFVFVELDKGGTVEAHPKQCWRLRKVKK